MEDYCDYNDYNDDYYYNYYDDGEGNWFTSLLSISFFIFIIYNLL